MAINTPKPSPIPTCIICCLKKSASVKFEVTKICDECSEKVREGRDNTTRAVKLQQTTQRGQAKAARAKFNRDRNWCSSYKRDRGGKGKHYTVRRHDLRRIHHEKIEAWILEQAGVKFDPKAAPGKLRVVIGGAV